MTLPGRTLQILGVVLTLAIPPCSRAGEVVFVAYNLENYRVEAESDPEAGRPPIDVERAELIAEILATFGPSIIGVSEIGGQKSLRDLHQRLRERGMDLPHLEIVDGPDEARRLGLLSRFPIIARDSRPHLAFQDGGERFQMRRGILDVTVELPNGSRLHCIGLHLKSRRPVPEDEERIRRHEAHLVRRHLDRIFDEEPEARLLLYGDLNTYRNEIPAKEIMGVRGDPGHLYAVPLADAHGDRWTHYWGAADLYSRIDYIMLSRPLRPWADVEGSFLHRSDEMFEASDHRALVFKLQLPESAAP